MSAETGWAPIFPERSITLTRNELDILLIAMDALLTCPSCTVLFNGVDRADLDSARVKLQEAQG